MRNRIQKLSSVALIVLSGVLLLSPATGWLVRLQIKTACGAESPVDVAGLAASGNDPDFQDQLAGAVDTATAHYPAYSQTNDLLDPRVAALHALAIRFPNQPAIYAAAIRYALDGSVLCNRRVDEKPLARPGDAVNEYTNTQSGDTPPARISAFLTDCATGERLDPDNAFFAMYHAYGLFAAHRDQEAIAEVIAASNKPGYRDYVRDELRGRMRLAEIGHGGREGLANGAIWEAEIDPEHSAVRDMARLVTSQAILDERNGKANQGFELRRALRRIGGLMRTDSTTLIGSLVGSSVAAYASVKPGGAESPGDKNLTSDQRRTAHVNAYVAYLDRTGHHKEAIAYLAENADGLAARQVVNEDTYRDELFKALRLPVLWLCDLLVLLVCALLLVAGLVSWALGRLPAIAQAKGMIAASRWGMAIGMLTAAGAMIPSFRMVLQAAQAYDPFGGLSSSPDGPPPPPHPTVSNEDWLILAVYTVIGLLTLAASSASQSGNLRASRPWRFLAVLGVVGGALYCVHLSVLAPASDAGTLVALPFAYIAAALLVYRREPARVFSFLSTVFLTVVLTSLAGIGLFRAAHPIASLMARYSMYLGQYDFSGYGNVSLKPLVQAAVAAFVFLIPLLVAVCGALFGRHGRPASVATVNALKSATLPTACLLLLVYAVLLGFTLKQEAIVDRYIDANVVNEGRHLAALAHRPWPGRVD